jgi:hypothetical protein
VYAISPAKQFVLSFHTFGSKCAVNNNSNNNNKCMLIDVAISGDRNVIKKKPRKFQ